MLKNHGAGSFRIAAIQLNVAQSLDKVLKDVGRYLRAAKKKRVDIVCFPECCFDAGVKKNLAAVEEVRNLCKEIGIWCIVDGNVEESGKVFNTAFLIDSNGQIAGKHRKVHLCDPPGVSPGSGFKVFDTPFCRIGISICWDTVFPRTVEYMAKRGAKVIFCPLMWYYEKWAHLKNHRERERNILRSMILTRAFENLSYVVFSNVFDPKNERATAYSAIAESQGIIKEIVGKEGMIYADVDLDHIDNIRKRYLKEYNKKI